MKTATELSVGWMAKPVPDATKELFHQAFRWRRGDAEWDWRCAENPYGMIAAEAHDENLAAHYGGYPTLVSLQGTEHRTYQIGDVMTAPGRRNGWILKRAYDYFVEETTKREPVPFMFGFNADTAREFGRLKMHYHSEAIINRLERPAGMRVRAAGKRIRLRIVRRFGAETDRLYHSCRKLYSCLLHRGAGYLNWRYADCPSRRYVLMLAESGLLRRRLHGYLVFSEEKESLHLVDFLFPPAEGAALARAVEQLPGTLKTAGLPIRTWHPGHSPLHPYLMEAGFRPILNEAPLYLTHRVMRPGIVPEPAAAWIDTNLYYTMGDSDLH